MKRFVLTALAALALASAAAAQPEPPAAPMASDHEATTSEQAMQERAVQAQDRATSDMLRSVQTASTRMHLACAEDRTRLCADSKTGFRADRCLEAHRREVAAPCRAALAQAAMAWNNPR